MLPSCFAAGATPVVYCELCQRRFRPFHGRQGVWMEEMRLVMRCESGLSPGGLGHEIAVLVQEDSTVAHEGAELSGE